MSSFQSQERGFSLHVTITVAPSHIDAFLAAFRPCYDAVTAEPECTYFEIFHSLEEPGMFRIVENWTQSPQWFQEVWYLYFYSVASMPLMQFLLMLLTFSINLPRNITSRIWRPQSRCGLGREHSTSSRGFHQRSGWQLRKETLSLRQSCRNSSEWTCLRMSLGPA